MLEVLADAPGLVLVTTHFDSLKALAETDTRFRNAGMEYDLQKLRPTFRLRDGVPGRSYASTLPRASACRLQCSTGARADGRRQPGIGRDPAQPAASASRRWNDRIRRWKPPAASWSRPKRISPPRPMRRKRRRNALTRRERDLAVHSREAIDAAVREAREAISEIVREAKRTRTAQAVEAARVALDRKAKEATAALPEAEPLDVTKLRQALANRALGVSSTSKKAGTSFAKASDRAEEPVSTQNWRQHIGPARPARRRSPG